MKKYDIFISYRRTSYDSANLIATRLKAAGYRVFFDLESMRSGPFNKQLFEVIEGCKDFVLVLSPNALDRCVSEDDWVRQEIMHAQLKGKNIVPILLNGFKWPEPMPIGMENLSKNQGVAASPDFFDLAMERLNTYLKSYKYTKKRIFIKWFLTIAASIAILFLSLFFVFRSIAKPLCKEVADYMTQQICVLDLMLEDNKLLIDAWSNIETIDKLELTGTIKMVQRNVKEYRNAMDSKLILSPWQDFLISLYGTNASAMTTMDKLTDMKLDDIEKRMEVMLQVGSMNNIHPSNKELVQRTLSLLEHSCASHFYAYLQILNKFPESSLEGYYQLAKRWVNMPTTGLGLEDSQYDILVEQKNNIIQEEMSKINKLNLKLKDDVYDQELKLDSINNAALAKYRERVASIAITSNDDVHKNWDRVVFFASMLKFTIDFFNEAKNAGEDPGVITPEFVFEDLSKMLDDFQQQYPSEKYVSAARFLYRKVLDGTSLAGVIITEFAPGTTHDTYHIGDIIVEWNGKKIENKTDLKNAYEKSPIGEQKILRLKEGILKKISVSIPDKVDNVMFKNLFNE